HTPTLHSAPPRLIRIVLSIIRPPPTSTLFPYTTLFRSSHLSALLSPSADAALPETCQGQRLPAGSQTGAGTVLQRSQRDLLCSHPECGAGRFLRSEAAMGAAVSFGGADH